MKRVVLLCTFVLTTALAQSALTPLTLQSTPGNPVVGVWQVSFPNDGGPPVEGVVGFNPDGTYREEMTSQGQQVAFWEGRYTLAPDGTLTQTETNKSPQFCFQGQCEPNDGPSVTTSRLSAQGPNSITLTYAEGSETYTLTFQRVGAAAQPQPGPQPAPQVCSGPVPAPGYTQPGPAPAEIGTNPWAGDYSDGDVTLHLAGPGADYFERGGQRYPLQLTGTNERLGTFSSDGNSFPVVLERFGSSVVLSSGNARFTLQPAPDGAVQPANPLGN